MGTDFIYIDESIEKPCVVVSALGLPDDTWREAFEAVKAWRKSLHQRFGIDLKTELHASSFLAGRGSLGSQTVGKNERASIFREALQVLADLGPEKVWIINSCSAPRMGHDTHLLAVEWLVNRVHTSLNKRGRWGKVIIDQTRESEIKGLVRRLRARNPIPSQFGSWADGQYTKNISATRILDDAEFRNSRDDYFIQLVDFVAYTLLSRERPPDDPEDRSRRYGIHRAFEILVPILNKAACRYDPLGVVRERPSSQPRSTSPRPPQVPTRTAKAKT